MTSNRLDFLLQVEMAVSALRNDAFYTDAARKQTKMAAGGNTAEKGDSWRTDK